MARGPEVMSRKQARTDGLRFYFTGKLCPHGHISERYVSCGMCLACQALRANSEKRSIYIRQHYLDNKTKYREHNRKWMAQNPDRVKEIRERWIKANPDKEKERLRDSARKSYARNPEEGRKRSRQWKTQNPEKTKAILSEWRKANPEKCRAYAVNRRARKLASPGSFTGDDIKAIIARQKGRCAACGEKAKLHMDHIMPLALGGSGDRTNFQGLCRFCNLSKHARHPIDFNRSKGLLL